MTNDENKAFNFGWHSAKTQAADACNPYKHGTPESDAYIAGYRHYFADPDVYGYYQRFAAWISSIAVLLKSGR